MKMAVFWVVAPCSLVEVYQRFRGAASINRPDVGGSKVLWNVGKLLPYYTALQPRIQPSSYSPPWEPQILLILIWSFTCPLVSQVFSSTQIFRVKFCTYFSSLKYMQHAPHPSLDHLNSINTGHEPPRYEGFFHLLIIASLEPNILLSALFPNTLNQCSFLNVRDKFHNLW
jgi:hypothetical protein